MRNRLNRLLSQGAGNILKKEERKEEGEEKKKQKEEERNRRRRRETGGGGGRRRKKKKKRRKRKRRRRRKIRENNDFRNLFSRQDRLQTYDHEVLIASMGFVCYFFVFCFPPETGFSV